jgi:tryptophanyl-tRNA synthetase
VISFTTTFRERILELLKDDVYFGKVVKTGRDKVHERAAWTTKEVREIIGFKSF